MKGIVFQLRRNLRLPTVRKPKLSLKEYLQKRGVFLFFFLMFLVGLITGAAYSKHADVDLFDRLDFLFSTNLTERAQMSSFEIFEISSSKYLSISSFVSFFMPFCP